MKTTKVTTLALLPLLLLIISSCVVVAAPIDHTSRILPPDTTPYHLAHLHVNDPFSLSWSFYCNKPGSIVQDGIIKNGGSDIRIISPNGVSNFQVGIQGGESGKIVDLGTIDTVSKSYNCDYYSCFSGIKFSADGVLVVPDKSMKENPIDLSGMTIDNVEVKLGHVYLAKISSGSDDTSLFVKFIVSSVSYDATNKLVEATSLRHQTMYVKIQPSYGRGECSKTLDHIQSGVDSSISLSVISLLLSIVVGVGNVAFLIYYCAFAVKKRSGVYGNLNQQQ